MRVTVSRFLQNSCAILSSEWSPGPSPQSSVVSAGHSEQQDFPQKQPQQCWAFKGWAVCEQVLLVQRGTRISKQASSPSFLSTESPRKQQTEAALSSPWSLPRLQSYKQAQTGSRNNIDPCMHRTAWRDARSCVGWPQLQIHPVDVGFASGGGDLALCCQYRQGR